MNMLDRLMELMEQKLVNKRQLAIKTGIPPTTVYGWWNKGFENMTLPTLRKLSSFLGCSMEYLVNGSDEDDTNGCAALSSEDKEIISLYHSLDERGKKLVQAVLNEKYKASSYEMPKADPYQGISEAIAACLASPQNDEKGRVNAPPNGSALLVMVF